MIKEAIKLKKLLHWTSLFTAYVLILSLQADLAHAAEPAPPGLNLDFRYRYEFVDQDGFAKNAYASTLRTRLAYRSPHTVNFGFLIEFDDLRPIGNDLYNSTRNGNTSRPVVADPTGTVVNQALILYRGIEDTVVRAGRRRITLDNHRFIGDVGWRQNDQTYDGVSISNTSLRDTSIEYVYVDRVNRIFGPDGGTPSADFQSDSHILNVKHELLPNLDVTAYAYLLDFEKSPSSSNKTFGIRTRGSNAVSERTSISYTVEYARQTNYGDNPDKYNANYYLLEGTLTTAGVTGKLGYEVLGGNSVQAFQTPLSTLHAFQGWADKFLVTPADGIEDFYLSLGTKIRGANIALVYHRFRPEAGGPVYGSEWDLVIKRPIAKRYSIVVKYADYNARNFSTDTRKLWFMVIARFSN